MSSQPKKAIHKKELLLAISCLSLWLALGIMLVNMLNNNGGIDGIILEKPMLFFGLLVASMFFLATGLNNLFSYLARNKQ